MSMLWDYWHIWLAALVILGLLWRWRVTEKPFSISGQVGPKYRTCPRCTASLRWQQNQCDVCNWPGELECEERPEQVHQAIHRMLYRFRELGAIRDGQFKSILKATSAVLTSTSGGKKSEDAAPIPAPVAANASEPLSPNSVSEPAAPVTPPAPVTPVKEPAAPAPTASSESVSTRVENYAARRRVATAEAAVAASAAPAKPKRDWGHVFRGFLERHNIMWGELVGGLMIVTCSIALVISFWAEIAERPLLKFGIFNSVSAALFAAGFYTDRRWKIHTTSQGVLITAILLVPLNFLAIAAFTANSPPSDFLPLAGEGISLALFAALTYFAARTISPHAPWATAVCVMTCSLAQLLVRRFAGPDASLAVVYALAAVPVASYTIATLFSLYRSSRIEAPCEQQITNHLAVLGVCVFAALLPLSLLLFQTGDVAGTLQWLAPLLVVIGGPALATTILFWQPLPQKLVSLRVILGSVGVFGGLALVASVALAWPLPIAMLATTLVNAAVWFALAKFADMPRALFLANAFVACAWLVGAAVFWEDIGWMLPDASGLMQSALSTAGGARLLPLVAVFSVIAVVCRRFADEEFRHAWELSAGAAAVLSVALLLIFGFGREGDAVGVTWYLALYATLATAAAAVLDHRKLAWGATALLLASIIQGVVFRYGMGWSDVWAWINALLAHATATVALCFAAKLWRPRRSADFCDAFARVGLGVSLFAAGVLVASSSKLEYVEVVGRFFWIAALWLGLSWLLRRGAIFVAFQAALAAAVAVLVTARLADEAWFAGATRWLDPRFLQAQAIALAVSAIGWRLLRLVGERIAPVRDKVTTAEFHSARWWAFDRTVGAILFGLVLILAAYAAFPGMARELSPSVEPGGRVPVSVSSFELLGLSSRHAAGSGSWFLLSATVLLLGLGCWDRGASVRVLGLYLLGTAACLLGAAQFTDQTATASALRWLIGSYTLVAATAIVVRRRVRPWLKSFGIKLDPLPRFIGTSLSQAARSAVVGVVVALYLAIGGFVTVAALQMGPPTPGAHAMFVWTGSLALIAGVAWLATGWQTARHGIEHPSIGIIKLGRAVLAVVAVVPLLIVASYVVATRLTQRPLVGPDPGSWFAGLGNSILYGGPLALLALVLLAFAIRERSSRHAFSFGLLTAGVATLVCLLELAADQRSLDMVAWIELAQLNAASMAIVALGWWGALVWKRSLDQALTLPPRLLQLLAALSAIFAGKTLLAGCWGIFLYPTQLSWQAAVATPGGLAATLLATAAVWVSSQPRGKAISHTHVGGLLLLAVCLCANLAVHFDTGRWEPFHTLLVGSAVAGWAIAYMPERWRSTGWNMLFVCAAVVLALRELIDGAAPPSWLWWSVGGLVSAYGVLLRIAVVNGRRWPVWLSAPLLFVAGHTWWWEVVSLRGANALVSFLDISVILLSLAAIVSVLIESRWNDLLQAGSNRWGKSAGYHRLGVWVATVGLLVGAAVDLFVDSGMVNWPAFWWLWCVAMATAIGAAVLSLWDRDVRFPIAAFYCIGLAAVGRFVGILQFQGDAFTWAFTLALAAFVLATSYLWHHRNAISHLLAYLGAPEDLQQRLNSQVWMLFANSVASFVVVYLVSAIEISNPAFTERMTAAYAVLACALAFVFLAAGRAETVLRYVALVTGALFAVAFAWAWVSPTLPAPNLHRLVAAAVALVAVVPVYSTLLVKVWRRSNAWVDAAQRMIPALVASAGALLAITLAMEVFYFARGTDVPLAWPALLAIALAVGTLAISSLGAAIIPGRDPLKLTERGRTAYVYAAEAFVALLFLHFRVTMPWLFGGIFTRYWPFVVMLMAFAGVGLSEWFARRKKDVLAEPLGNTGMLLPLLPVVSFWASGQTGQYALLLVAVGGLYAAMSVMRRSAVLMGLALLAFNGSLWSLLSSVEGLGLLVHPQFWLIPPVLCVLVGAELNRGRITSTQLRGIRYGCTVTIYATSTADIFINGVGDGLWMPVVLAGLSLAGVFAGILLRVRAFLFLGIAFLCVSLFSVIWHAAVELERTWIWWITGIVTGIAIIVLFGLFEKKRDEAIALVDSLKQWEA